MNSQKKRNNLRKTMYIKQYREKNEVRLLRLHLIKTLSTEKIIDSAWPENNEQEIYLVNLLATFKNQLDRYPTDSMDNRCLTKTYLYTVKNRYRKNRRDCFTSNEGIYVKFWEMTAFCPLCKSVFKAVKAKQHLNNEHPEVTAEQRNAVNRLAKFTLATCKPNKKIAKKITTNATDVLNSSKYRLGYSGTVSGGAFGQGKRH
ncbi:hypothetical protein CBG25_12685 [Arsenophonus sp. ENCA]|uniref:hypothetical protein n=1 Tax=Arsenophonus sp. ENCA TaxID=1987579 RepID=UPI000BCB0020|nr:hypothetical protein [Arsenophonus sp. ENCA]PAV02123.1 hypothetical protein CBG25_12685 [Arsenophonus sp. ENCA]